jgi:hypothetical protein
VTRVCTICSHPAKESIDSALVRRTPYRAIARRYRVSTDALSRHLNDHLADYVQQALRKYGLEKGVKVLDKLNATLNRLDSFLDEAEGKRDAREFVIVAAELRKELELLAKLQGDLQQEGAVNINLHPEWLTIEATIGVALEPYPAAREAVVSALKELPNGNGG